MRRLCVISVECAVKPVDVLFGFRTRRGQKANFRSSIWNLLQDVQVERGVPWIFRETASAKSDYLALFRIAFLQSSLILFVADFFHPIDGLAVELLLNGDMCHSRAGGGAVPMLLTGREQDNITGPNFFDWATPALRSAGPLPEGCEPTRL